VSLSDCKFVWKNGQVVPWEQATVHVSSHGLHYGTGVFEGMRCYKTSSGPAVFRLSEHLDRWLASASVYGMKLPYSRQQLAQATLQIISANGFEGCYIRPIAFYGSDGLSVHPRNCPVEVMIFAWPWGAYLGGDALERGIRATVSPWRKFQSDAIPATAKACGQYLNSVLAVQDAIARGYDEAILLDSAGCVTEGSGENLFIVKGGRLCTNDERSSVLMGITRDAVLRLAREMGIAVSIQQLTLADVQQADEAFFTGTAVEVTPVASIDDHPIGAGKRGPVTAMLQRAFFDVTGGTNPQYANWLTPVPTAKNDERLVSQGASL